MRNLATLFFLGARLMWMSTILYSASLIVSMMLGWDPDGMGFPTDNSALSLAIGSPQRPDTLLSVECGG